jgi:hypothetical protein
VERGYHHEQDEQEAAVDELIARVERLDANR